MSPATQVLKESSAAWVETLMAVQQELENEIAASAKEDDSDEASTSLEIRSLLLRLQRLETTMAHLAGTATEIAEKREGAVVATHQQIVNNDELLQQLMEGLKLENGLSQEEQWEQEALHEQLKSMFRNP